MSLFALLAALYLLGCVCLAVAVMRAPHESELWPDLFGAPDEPRRPNP